MKKNELWLIWRIQDQTKDKKIRRRYRVGVLKFNAEQNIWSFEYDYDHDFELAKKNGFNYFPGFKDTRKGHVECSEGTLFSSIASRLPQKDRDDYLDVLNRYGLDINDDEFTVLSTTKARQVTDNYEFVPAFNKEKIEFEVAGVNHRDFKELDACIKNSSLAEGSKVLLVIDEDNEFDKNAIKILLPAKEKSVLIGYVPRYYNSEIKRVLESGIDYSAIISKVDMKSNIRDEKISIKMRLIFA